MRGVISMGVWSDAMPPLSLLLSTVALTAPPTRASSWLRVRVGSARDAVVEHGWLRTPPVSVDALFGTRRFAINVGPHSFWYEYRLNSDVIAHARTRQELRHAVDVALSAQQTYDSVVVSPDVADALRRATRHGLEARVRATVVQLGGACSVRSGDDPEVVQELARCVMQQALAKVGVAAM